MEQIIYVIFMFVSQNGRTADVRFRFEETHGLTNSNYKHILRYISPRFSKWKTFSKLRASNHIMAQGHSRYCGLFRRPHVENNRKWYD
jgi:hypothetical protein